MFFFYYTEVSARAGNARDLHSDNQYTSAPAVDAEKILNRLDFANRRGHAIRPQQPPSHLQKTRVCISLFCQLISMLLLQVFSMLIAVILVAQRVLQLLKIGSILNSGLLLCF